MPQPPSASPARKVDSNVRLIAVDVVALTLNLPCDARLYVEE